MTDESAGITADDAHDEIHATTLALAAHQAVGDISDEDARDDGPRREICYVIQHNSYFSLISKIPSTSCSTNGPSLHSKSTLGSKHSTPCHTFLGMSTP